MKLYTAKYDADRPSTKSVEVPLNSSFGVAVGVKYNGEDVNLKQNEVLLDGELSASDVIDDKYLVFKLSSDGEAGYDKYSVASTTDGMTVVEKSYKYYLTPQEISSAQQAFKCDTLNGVTIQYPVGSTTGQSPVFSDKYNIDWPLILIGKDTSANKWTYAGVPTYIYGLGADGQPDYSKPIAQIGRSNQGFTNYYYTLKVPNAEYTNWIYANEFTVPENGMWLCKSVASYQYPTESHYDYTYTERISRQFDLYVKKADKGKIEGYGDEYVFKNTVNLSGTYADDTEFSFEVPVVEE